MPPVLDAEGLSLSSTLVEQFMFGLMLVGPDRRVRYLNHKARQLLLPPQSHEVGSWSCCELICHRLGPVVGGCLSEQALASEGGLPEVRMDVASERLETAAWVTVSHLGPTGSDLLFHLRPGRTGDRRRRTDPTWTGEASSSERAEMRISTLGKVEIEGKDGPINGSWLEQRPGQLLKYLLCERRRIISSDQAVEALWPEAGIEEGQSRLRYTVHALREKLEPERVHRSTGRHVVARRGGYVFDTSRVWLDVDEFEREAAAGLAAFDQSQYRQATEHLASALRLYRGDFLSDEPYAEWAHEERERLRGMAAKAMRSQARIEIVEGRFEAAAQNTRRLADLEPFDNDVHRLLIEICLRSGRRSEAHRRYTRFKRRMNTVFDCEPDFDLSGVERQIGGPEPTSADLSPAAGRV